MRGIIELDLCNTQLKFSTKFQDQFGAIKPPILDITSRQNYNTMRKQSNLDGYFLFLVASKLAVSAHSFSCIKGAICETVIDYAHIQFKSNSKIEIQEKIS